MYTKDSFHAYREYLVGKLKKNLKNLKAFISHNRHLRPEKKDDEMTVLHTMGLYSLLRYQFIAVLSIATVIASLGLMGDSAVAIIGAMLIAPLMKPILAFSYAAVSGHMKLQIRSFATLVIGVIITLLVSYLTETIVGLHELTGEILSRTKPSLIDLGIAIAAGIAAAMASVRSNVTDTLPGVAVAVALLPPLSAAAICLSVGAWDLMLGALLLFCVNLVAIILVAMLVFWLDGYGTIRYAWPTLLVILAICVSFAIPLNQTMQQLKYDDLAQEVVEEYLQDRYEVEKVIHPDDLSKLITALKKDHIFIFLELKSPRKSFTKQDLKTLHNQLTKIIKLPVNLKVQLIITDEHTLYMQLEPDGSQTDYGNIKTVPRR